MLSIVLDRVFSLCENTTFFGSISQILEPLIFIMFLQIVRLERMAKIATKHASAQMAPAAINTQANVYVFPGGKEITVHMVHAYVQLKSFPSQNHSVLVMQFLHVNTRKHFARKARNTPLIYFNIVIG